MIEPSHPSDLPSSLTKTLASADLSDLAAVSVDLTEVALDAFLEEGVHRDLPVFSTLVGLWKTGRTVRDALFVRKLGAFLLALEKTTVEQRREMIDGLADTTTQENVGEKLVGLLDRFESSVKAALLGRAFSVYVARKITRDEFWRVSFVIDRLPMTDIMALREWRSVDLNHVEHVRKHLYLAAGMGWFVMNTSSTGFNWTERLCVIFADLLLSPAAAA